MRRFERLSDSHLSLLVRDLEKCLGTTGHPTDTRLSWASRLTAIREEQRLRAEAPERPYQHLSDAELQSTMDAFRLKMDSTEAWESGWYATMVSLEEEEDTRKTVPLPEGLVEGKKLWWVTGPEDRVELLEITDVDPRTGKITCQWGGE